MISRHLVDCVEYDASIENGERDMSDIVVSIYTRHILLPH